MMMESWRGDASPSTVVARSTPQKRSFDVAFLTGSTDTADADQKERKYARIKKYEEEKLKTPDEVKSDSRPISEERSSSAFTRVTRNSLTESTVMSALNVANSIAHSWSQSPSFEAVSSLLNANKALPLIGSHSFLPNALAPFLSPISTSRHDRLNNNLVEEYFKTQHHLMAAAKVSSSNATVSQITKLRNSLSPSTESFKLPFGGFPYIGGSNPIMETPKIPNSFIPQPHITPLMPPLASLSLPAQNLCAKCNISFRMTSDLVYHMRSQHKREPDPDRRRRNEKLKCPICHETFRERHHLTRHMTAHQDREEEVEKN